nr:uncharacterized mitochondrial protein AtMg00820-like [Nicotiana tomentosiformis]
MDECQPIVSNKEMPIEELVERQHSAEQMTEIDRGKRVTKPPICPTEPRNFKEASQNQRWIEAMQHEVDALEQNHTWELVDIPEGKQTVGSKWVYKVKYKPNREVDKYKARLVAKDYTQ